jgi:hypothetical protein
METASDDHDHEAAWGAQLRQELCRLEEQHPTWMALAAAARVVLASLPGEPVPLRRQRWKEWGPCCSPPRQCGCGPRGRHKKECTAKGAET